MRAIPAGAEGPVSKPRPMNHHEKAVLAILVQLEGWDKEADPEVAAKALLHQLREAKLLRDAADLSLRERLESLVHQADALAHEAGFTEQDGLVSTLVLRCVLDWRDADCL